MWRKVASVRRMPARADYERHVLPGLAVTRVSLEDVYLSLTRAER